MYAVLKTEKKSEKNSFYRLKWQVLVWPPLTLEQYQEPGCLKPEKSKICESSQRLQWRSVEKSIMEWRIQVWKIFGSNRRQYLSRRFGERWKNECLWPSVKHGGGSVLVRGCISASGVGDVVQIDGIMNAEEYKQVLFFHAIPYRKSQIGNVFIFQHDNNPKYTANAVKSYLVRKTADKTLTIMDWPPQSPDLNIIGAGWDHLDRERNERQHKL